MYTRMYWHCDPHASSSRPNTEGHSYGSKCKKEKRLASFLNTLRASVGTLMEVSAKTERW